MAVHAAASPPQAAKAAIRGRFHLDIIKFVGVIVLFAAATLWTVQSNHYFASHHSDASHSSMTNFITAKASDVDHTVHNAVQIMTKDNGKYVARTVHMTPAAHLAPSSSPTTKEGVGASVAKSSYPSSPRHGSDISPANQISLLQCKNQSRCIVPELQLQKRMKIYLCRHPVRHGVRFYYLVSEGLLLHPNVQLLPMDRIDEAEYIIYLPGSAPWHLTECTNKSFVPRLIVLDEFDGHQSFMPKGSDREMAEEYGASRRWYHMYFKRSYVLRGDGHFRGYPHLQKPNFFPMVYAIAEAYTQQDFVFKRSIDVLCTLRGSKQMATRLRVQEWMKEYAAQRNISNAVLGEVDHASRTTVSKGYFERMFNAEIIVTVNPSNWEGDFRLWEAMATGALVFVDPVNVPHPHPLVDNRHVVYFSNSNRSDLFQKLDFYRKNKDLARQVAVGGYLHAMKHHRTVSLVDYILRSAHALKAQEEGLPLQSEYTFTAQQLRDLAAKYEARLKKKKVKV